MTARIAWIACLTWLGLCVGSAHAGPDWQQTPLCRAEEFIDASGFDRCRDWIRKVQQPIVAGLEDQSRPTCCSEADAYEADEFEIGPDGAHFAIITRDYPDVPAGTRIVIPAYKFNLAFDEGGNPSGHGIVFMNGNMNVLCYFTPSLQ